MMYGWTAAKLRAAIEQREKRTEKLVKEHASPEAIEESRKGMDKLHRWLEEAERKERG